MPERRYLGLWMLFTCGLLLLVGLPYLGAWQATKPGQVFTGFLFNPIDGFTYLAKMHQGWSGSWTFSLPYTSQPGEGVYLYTFYLALGHLARILNAPLVWVFHLARLLAVPFLVGMLQKFLRVSLPPDPGLMWSMVLVVFGSGLGWLAVLGGGFTSDLWVAEGFPFLSAYANPHFTLSLALMCYLLAPPEPPSASGWRSGWGYGAAGLVLSSLSPFGAALSAAVCAILAVWQVVDERRVNLSSPWLQRFTWLAVGSGPLLLYTLWVMDVHPVLAGWNRQNITPAPPVWDVFLSLSPALLAGFFGAWSALIQRRQAARPALVWACLCLGLLYAPLDLQRRFLIGVFVPVTILAAWGLQALRQPAARRRLALVILVVSLPSNAIVLLAAWQGAASQDERIYLSEGEAAAFRWLEDNSAGRVLVLAGPETGLLIPGYTGQRVIYGHPFETVNAGQEKQQVEAVFSGSMGNSDVLTWMGQREVDLVFYGPREQKLGPAPFLDRLQRVYQSGGVQIFQVAGN